MKRLGRNLEKPMTPEAAAHSVTHHFFVDKTPVSTTQPTLTGAQIKALVPGVDPTDLLELRDEGKKIPIKDDQVVEIDSGMHFVTYPGGDDS
jgi:hypothetical protein